MQMFQRKEKELTYESGPLQIYSVNGGSGLEVFLFDTSTYLC